MDKIISKKMADYGKLVGATIYRERSNCENYVLNEWSDSQRGYLATSESGEKETLLPEDLSGDILVKERKKLYVANRETGAFIEEVNSIEEGRELIEEFETIDREERTYTAYYYDIVDEEHCSVE